jgi:hypothetical protein
MGVSQSISRNGSRVVRSEAATSWRERAAVRGSGGTGGESVVVAVMPMMRTLAVSTVKVF